MQAIITLPVVVWLFFVQPISLRTMHDDEEDAGDQAWILLLLCLL